MTDEKETLERFGEMVISARDNAISEILADIKSSSENQTGASSFLKSYDIDQELIVFIVNHFLFKLMYSIQDAKIENEIEIATVFNEQTFLLQDISDGIAGEFMTEEGWISTKSKYKDWNA